jgi:hypothetical protein
MFQMLLLHHGGGDDPQLEHLLPVVVVYWTAVPPVRQMCHFSDVTIICSGRTVLIEIDINDVATIIET